MIEIKDLNKSYKLRWEEIKVLKNININIGRGEFVSLVGPSGSGKSTLMNIVGGLDKPSSGSIIIDGKDISKLKDEEMAKFRRESIGFVFQSFNLDPSMNALENVMMPLVFAGMPEKERRSRALKALEDVELGDRVRHKPTELSGGQCQRVSIARALINKPSIILADEPTGNLDSKNGEIVMGILKKLREQEYTIIMVTHNLESAAAADTIIKMSDGEVVGE